MDDDAGIVALRGGHVVTVLTLHLRDGLVEHIHALVDPVKLAPVVAALGI